MGCHFLIQRIFPTQGLNPGLPHCRQPLYHVSHRERNAQYNAHDIHKTHSFLDSVLREWSGSRSPLESERRVEDNWIHWLQSQQRWKSGGKDRWKAGKILWKQTSELDESFHEGKFRIMDILLKIMFIVFRTKKERKGTNAWNRLPWWLSWYRICLHCGRTGFNPWVGKIPWRREQLPTLVFWPGEFHELYGPWGGKKWDMTEWLSLLEKQTELMGKMGMGGFIFRQLSHFIFPNAGPQIFFLKKNFGVCIHCLFW